MWGKKVEASVYNDVIFLFIPIKNVVDFFKMRCYIMIGGQGLGHEVGTNVFFFLLNHMYHSIKP